jgi:hypothetical protein
MTSQPAHRPKGDIHEQRRPRVTATARRRVNVDVDLLAHALVLIAEELAQDTIHDDN